MNKKLDKISPEESNIFPSNGQAKQFHTHDLGCSAALISMGFQLISLDKQNPKKVKFIFFKRDGIDKAVTDYWSDRMRLKARTFFDNIKMLKNRIYSEF